MNKTTLAVGLLAIPHDLVGARPQRDSRLSTVIVGMNFHLGVIMHRLVLMCSLLAAPILAQAQTSQTCAPVTEQQVKGFFDRWNASLKTLNPDEVLKNYASDAILLPTVSNQPRLTQAERRDYFVHFLENKPQGVIDQRVIRLGCNDAIDSGLYTFTMGDGKTVPARYTFVYSYQDGKWLIVSHHSSAMPEKK
jgi:uncharacterized protein (TIGR02246 family)